MKRRKKDEKLHKLVELWKKTRKFWKINPRTRVKPNKKKKNRMKRKRDLKRRIREEE